VEVQGRGELGESVFGLHIIAIGSRGTSPLVVGEQE